ncbi:TRADD-N-associated membrane domain-containing protein [Shewanella chilikensis]|uniref:TRADD-N-associated membrane domain-containing protein n=1 Tax=Shewanella chilikensis TaxID=558541 RepID=UPI003B680BF5
MTAEVEKENYLDKRIAELKDRRKKVQGSFYIAVFISLTLMVIVPVFVWSSEINPRIAPLIIAYIVIPLGMLPILRGRVRDLEQEVREAEFEIDLQQFERTLIETKAEKTLRLNDAQLQRYYSLNLSQNTWVFVIGIGCMLSGLILVAATIYLVINHAENLDSKIITATLGGIGTLLTSYVAAIFLKMHASATQHLGGFHSRLVDTHQILLASVVASRIGDEALREKTLSELSLKVASKEDNS